MKTDLIKNKRKVVIGFKGSPSLRTELCTEANDLGITLSSHVETIVENQSNYRLEIANLKRQISDLNDKISLYETPHLKKLFEDCKGKPASYIDDKGETKVIAIITIQDVFELLIHSYKTIDI